MNGYDYCHGLPEIDVPKSNIVFICLHSGWTLRVITSGCEMWQVKFYLLRRLLGVKTEGDGKAGKVAKLKKGEILMAAWLARSKLSWSICPSFGSWTARLLPCSTLPYDKCGKNQTESRYSMRHVLPMSFPSHPGRVSHRFFEILAFQISNIIPFRKTYIYIYINSFYHLLIYVQQISTIPGIPMDSWDHDLQIFWRWLLLPPWGQHWIHRCRWQSASPRQWP